MPKILNLKISADSLNRPVESKHHRNGYDAIANHQKPPEHIQLMLSHFDQQPIEIFTIKFKTKFSAFIMIIMRKMVAVIEIADTA